MNKRKTAWMQGEALKQAVYQDIFGAIIKKYICKCQSELQLEMYLKRRVQTNQDIIGELCIAKDGGVLAIRDEDKKIAGKNYHEKHENIEFIWNKNNFSEADKVSSVYCFKVKYSTWSSESISKNKIENMIKLTVKAAQHDIRPDNQASAQHCFRNFTTQNCCNRKKCFRKRESYRELKLADHYRNVDENTGQHTLDAISFHARRQNYSSPFHLQTAIGEIFIQKEGFVIYFC